MSKQFPLYTLEDLGINIRGGVSIAAPTLDTNDPTVDVLTLSAIAGGRFNETASKKLPESVIDANWLRVQPNTVLLGRSNTPELVGAAAFVSAVRDRVFLPDLIWEVRPPNPDSLDPYWLYLALTRARQRGELKALASGTSRSMVKLSMARLRTLAIPVPQIQIQRRIARAFKAHDATQTAIERTIAAKRAQKRGLMQQLLTGKVRFSGLSEPWKTVRLGDIVNLRGSKSTSSQQPNLRCIELEHIESGTGEIIGEASVGSTVSLKTEFAPGDVLFGKLRPYLRKFALVQFAGLCSTEIWALIPDQTVITSGYLRLLVEAPAVQRAANATSGTKMPRADWDVVSTTPLHLPPKSEQDRIAHLASAIDREIRLLSAQCQALATQRRGLMERLLSGEIDIPSFDTSAA